jgi:hypothetical protein
MPLPWLSGEWGAYWPGLPFHRSAAFLVLPNRWRWEFLRRNPKIALLLADTIKALQLGQRVRDGAERAGEDHPDIERGRQAIDQLRNCYWIWLWLEDEDRELLIPPWVELGPSWLNELNPWDLTSRQSRAFWTALKEHRERLRLTGSNAQSDRVLQGWLQLWDARMGWNGFEYKPEAATGRKRMTLKRAARQARGVSIQRYYDVYKLVVGQEYSQASWEEHFLESHGWEWYERRTSHREPRKGVGRTRRARRLPTDLDGQVVVPAAVDGDYASEMFMRVLHSEGLDQAIKAVEDLLELSEKTKQQIREELGG